MERLFWVTCLGPKCHHSIFISRWQRAIWLQKRRKWCGDWSRDGSDAATSQGTPTDSRSWEQQVAGCPLEPPGGTVPADILILAPNDSFWTSGLQNRKKTSFCHFKLRNSRSFVTAAMGKKYIIPYVWMHVCMCLHTTLRWGQFLLTRLCTWEIKKKGV